MSQGRASDAARRDFAETIALQVLAWLAADPGRLGAFLAASGVAQGDIARQASDSRFLAGVMDHLLADEAALLACAGDLGIPPADFAPARAALPGGDVPHWT